MQLLLLPPLFGNFCTGANILERSPAVIGVVFLHYFATNGRSTFCAFQHLLTNILSTPAFLNAEWVMLYMNSAPPPGGICIGFCICFCVCFIFLLFAEVVTYEECTSSIKVAETGFILGSCQWENGA